MIIGPPLQRRNNCLAHFHNNNCSLTEGSELLVRHLGVGPPTDHSFILEKLSQHNRIKVCTTQTHISRKKPEKK